MKSLWNTLKKSKNKNISPAETVSLLPGSEQQEQKNTERLKDKAKHQNLKNVAVKINHTVYNICKKKSKQDFNSNSDPKQCKGSEATARTTGRSIRGRLGHERQLQLTDKTLKCLMENSQYYEVCVLICKSEDDEAGDGRELYYTISQKMWEEVRKALAGDQEQSTKLQTILQCIKWANETQGKKVPDWGPRGWTKELKDLFKTHIKETMPTFSQKNEDKVNLKDHLEQLKCKISEISSKVQMLPLELTFTYFKCLHGHLLNDLTSLTERKHGYEEQVLLYKWTQEEHGKLCKYLQGSADFDHMLFEKWFFDNGNKIESTGQETVRNVFQDILQHEIVWNSYANLFSDQCYFYKIQEVMISICEAVKDISATLVARMNSIFWEEFLKFLTRYKEFLKNNVDSAEGITSGKGVEMGIRIIHNTYILRNTILGLGNIQRKSEIWELLDQCENKGTEIVLRIMSPKMKMAFKNYFKEKKLDYENYLMEYQDILRKQGILNNKKFNTSIQHRITTLYIQSFFKSKSQNKVEAFVKGSKKLRELFTELDSDKDQLGDDPLEFMAQMLTAKDYKSLETTTIFFIDEHQDIRKEHMMAILKIKGGITREERENLLYYLDNRKADFGDCRLKYFEDVNIQCCNFKYLLCFQCLGA